MPPTGKAFAITQTHWFRTRDGVITEHWANRDDLAMARQAGWVPPSPGFLLRAAIAKRRTQPRYYALDPRFHSVPAGPAHVSRDADGVGVS